MDQKGSKSCYGAFNNHVDKILTIFDPLPPQMDKHGHFSDPLPMSMWTFNIPPPPNFSENL